MGAFMIKDCSSEPVHANDFIKEVRALRKQYENTCRRHDMRLAGQPVRSTSIDIIQGIEFHVFWYGDSGSRGQCIRIADIPGTLSGEILRLREDIPRLDGDHEIVGNEIRSLVGEEAPCPPIETPLDDSEDPADVFTSLPIVDIDIEKHFIKHEVYRREIVNHLRCQGGSCLGTPASPYIARLLGKTQQGHLVFEGLTHGRIFKAFDQLRDYKRWILNLISGLKCLHSLGIIHRNLRLGNLFLRFGGLVKPDLVIGGLGGRGGNDDAPEIPSQLILDCDFTEKTDIYDIGEAIKSMVYGELPATKAVERKVPHPLQGIVEACQHELPELRPGLSSLQMMVEKIQVVPFVKDEKIPSEQSWDVTQTQTPQPVTRTQEPPGML